MIIEIRTAVGDTFRLVQREGDSVDDITLAAARMTAVSHESGIRAAHQEIT